MLQLHARQFQDFSDHLVQPIKVRLHLFQPVPEERVAVQAEVVMLFLRILLVRANHKQRGRDALNVPQQS